MDDGQATLDVDVAVDDAQLDAGNSGGDPAAEPFLAVNDRTKYATREDAVKAYDEAGKRIAALSTWEKTAKNYGLGEPKHLEAIFSETLKARQELPQLRAELEALKKAQAVLAQPKPAANDPKAKEAEDVKKYLAELGYTSKADVDAMVKELKDELAGLKNNGSQAETTRLENQEAEAREWLSSQMSEAKIADDESGSKANIVGTLIKQVIESSDENLATWNRGGSGAMKLVKTAYEQVLNSLGWKPAETAAPNASAAQAASVGRRLQNSKTLPAQGTARNATATNQPAPKKGINADTHNKAWALLNKGQA